jgi:hypothetical protein
MLNNAQNFVVTEDMRRPTLAVTTKYIARRDLVPIVASPSESGESDQYIHSHSA